MSQSNVDLWPADLQPQDFLSPREILEHQAELLAMKMNGLLAGEVIEDEQSDRRVLRFEVVSIRADTRVKLFEVHQRKQLAYPVAVIPPEELPEFLLTEVYLPSAGASSMVFKTQGHWIASTPVELIKLLRKVLEMPVVKSTVISLLAEVDQSETKQSDAGNSAS